MAVDTSLYDLLGVPANANDNQIRKAYYLKARTCHPDKHPNDPSAKDAFQKLGHAYQVLSEPKARSNYDKFGLDSLEESGQTEMDPAILFTMLFGSDQFQHLIGQLALATVAANASESGEAPDEDVIDRSQELRSAELTKNLNQYLNSYVNGQVNEFRRWALDQAELLAQANFGVPLLHVIGEVYVQQANIAIGRREALGIPGVWRRMVARTKQLGSEVSAAAAAVSVLQAKLQMERTFGQGPGVSHADSVKLLERVANATLDFMWKMSVVDIEQTLSHVCQSVLGGEDLPPDVPSTVPRPAGKARDTGKPRRGEDERADTQRRSAQRCVGKDGHRPVGVGVGVGQRAAPSANEKQPRGFLGHVALLFHCSCASRQQYGGHETRDPLDRHRVFVPDDVDVTLRPSRDSDADAEPDDVDRASRDGRSRDVHMAAEEASEEEEEAEPPKSRDQIVRLRAEALRLLGAIFNSVEDKGMVKAGFVIHMAGMADAFGRPDSDLADQPEVGKGKGKGKGKGREKDSGAGLGQSCTNQSEGKATRGKNHKATTFTVSRTGRTARVSVSEPEGTPS